MTKETHHATDNQMAPNAPLNPLRERLLQLEDADLCLIQCQASGTEFSNTFDNAFKNGFKNIAGW